MELDIESESFVSINHRLQASWEEKLQEDFKKAYPKLILEIPVVKTDISIAERFSNFVNSHTNFIVLAKTDIKEDSITDLLRHIDYLRKVLQEWSKDELENMIGLLDFALQFPDNAKPNLKSPFAVLIVSLRLVMSDGKYIELLKKIDELNKYYLFHQIISIRNYAELYETLSKTPPKSISKETETYLQHRFLMHAAIMDNNPRLFGFLVLYGSAQYLDGNTFKMAFNKDFIDKDNYTPTRTAGHFIPYFQLKIMRDPTFLKQLIDSKTTVLEYFLTYSIRVDLETDIGRSILNEEVIKNFSDDNGNNFIHYFAKLYSAPTLADIKKAFLGAEITTEKSDTFIALINAKNNVGDTPLHYVVQRIFEHDKVTALIAAGAKIDVLNNKGQTPLILALTKEPLQLIIIYRLITEGANCTIKYPVGDGRLKSATELIEEYANKEKEGIAGNYIIPREGNEPQNFQHIEKILKALQQEHTQKYTPAAHMNSKS